MQREECIELIRSFIDEKLDGNIENLLNYDLSQLENDEKYGGHDPDNSKIANAIYVVLWGDKVPDLTYDGLGKSNEVGKSDEPEKSYRGDTMNSFHTLMGHYTDDHTSFTGIQKYTDSSEIIEMAKEYHKKYHTIGNMTIWPNDSIKLSELWREYTENHGDKRFTINTIRSYAPWYDYFDTFLSTVKEKVINSTVILEMTSFDPVAIATNLIVYQFELTLDRSWPKFEEFVHTFYYEKYVDLDTFEVLPIFSPYAYHWNKSYSREEYEQYVISYITKATEIIDYRGRKMIIELKKALRKRELTNRVSDIVSFGKSLFSSEGIPYILLGIIFAALCVYSIGRGICFFSAGGYNNPEAVWELKSLYGENVWFKNMIYLLMCLSPIFMCRVYKTEKTGLKKIVMTIMVFIQEIMALFLLILFLLYKVLVFGGNFIPLLLKEARGILILEEAAGWLYFIIFMGVIIVSVLLLAIEEEYREFAKFWGILWLLIFVGIYLVFWILSSKIATVLIGIVIAGALILALALRGYNGVIYRCPACKKFYALSFIDSNLLREEDISIKVSTERKNVSGEVIGTQEQYIPGKRKFYEQTYKCKNCGHIYTKVVTEDIKLI